MNFSDAKTLVLSALGGALEFYDFVIFVFFASVMGALFFPADLPDWMKLVQTFGIFAAGYLARPLGGVIMAHFGDLMGRKRMFMFSILLMSLPTIFIGLMPTYSKIGIVAPLLLLLMRICQGAAIGGEAPGAWVFVTEHVSKRHTGVACGSLSLGLVSGILLGSLVATLTNRTFSDAQVMDYGWRLPFLLGGVFGLITLYLRRYLHETPVFAELQKKKALAESMPIKMVIRDHREGVVISMLVTWILSAAVVVGVLMMPTFLQSPSIGLDRSSALEVNCFAILFVMVGCLVSGRLGDLIGNGRAMMIFSAGLGLSFLLFYIVIHQSIAYLLPLYCLCGFFIGITGLIPAIAVKAFPPEIRFSGVSFSYNLAYAIFGGLTPLLISLMVVHWQFAPAYYMAFLGVMGMGVGMVLRKQEKQQR